MRTISALGLFVVVSLLLRSTALTAASTRGVVIDALAFAAVVWGLRHGESWGATFGFILGLAADLDAAHWMGRHALVLALVGYAVGRLSHTLVRDSVRTHLVLLAVGTLVHETWISFFEFTSPGAWLVLAERVVVAAVVTTLVGTALLWIVRRVSGVTLFDHAAVEPGSSA